MVQRKGIILAGGSGTRLSPLTNVYSKHLLPVYDKPMIYYPITTLMLSGIREILIITSAQDIERYEMLLSDGSQWGVKFSYKIQPNPDGIAQALILGEKFIGQNPSALILGDNIFYGHNLQELLFSANNRSDGATAFAYHVNEPNRYGVAGFDKNNNIISIEEKPTKPKSNYAIVGLYFFDQQAIEFAKSISPSSRGEIEITDLNKIYLNKKKLTVEIMNRGYTWLDAGTHDSLLQASQFISTIEDRQGLKVACPEEISYRQGWINADKLEELSKKTISKKYAAYLMKVLCNK